MLEVPIFVENKQNLKKMNEIFEVGVPFPKGLFVVNQKIYLCNTTSTNGIPFSYKAVSHWNDGSIKWALFVFSLSLEPKESVELTIKRMKTEPVVDNHELVSVVMEDDQIVVDTGVLTFKMAQKTFNPFSKVLLVDGPSLEFKSELFLTLFNGDVYTAEVDLFRDEASVVSVGALRKELTFEGEFKKEGQSSGVKFLSKLFFFSDSSLVKWEFTIWNPSAALHPGGCWDLGDDGSILFQELSLNVEASTGSKLLWKDCLESSWQVGSDCFSLFQSGSGSESEHANVHKNAKGCVPDYFNGYKVTRVNESTFEGRRASPQIFISNASNPAFKGLAVCLEDFWQNFPKALNFQLDSLEIGLFPKIEGGQAYELQAGERKTHSMYFDFYALKEELDWVSEPSVCYIASSWYASCQVFPFMCADAKNDPLSSFIQQGVDGSECFERKREIIDEFGWRNFGDVYADHEALYQKDGEAPFVSHYNNQYDAIYGFARQFIQTGDKRWFKLMDELALHVTDIDIYHTENDRVEYNGGLFWHTDHYLDAQTCTHRTFSALNDSSSTPGQTGGGPGSEHCYTTGLMYHYFITGDVKSKNAVIKLSDWMINSHDGARSLLAQVLSAKKNELNKLVQVLKGQDPLPYRYPFTRGTGNYIVSLLDAYSLSGEKDRLYRIENVIKETVHPLDDISKRNLDDIETTWSYVVFLQAVSKYLLLKESLEEFDKPYMYARASFMHYAKWMLENEAPYLSRVEVLEFPNDTWVAQEVRKLSLFIAAARYSPDMRGLYCKRASEFLDYIVETLSNSKESHFSRIQILLMQNYGAHLLCDEQHAFYRDFDEKNSSIISSDFGVAPKAKAKILVFKIIKKLIMGFRYASVKGERDWLRTRS